MLYATPAPVTGMPDILNDVAPISFAFAVTTVLPPDVNVGVSVTVTVSSMEFFNKSVISNLRFEITDLLKNSIEDTVTVTLTPTFTSGGSTVVTAKAKLMGATSFKMSGIPVTGAGVAYNIEINSNHFSTV